MEHFVALFRELDSTTSTNRKVKALVRYFETADNKDTLWMIALFTGKRPRRSISTSLLREWAAEIADIPYWLFEESYHVVGDLAETIAIVLPPPLKSYSVSLTELIDQIIKMKYKEEPEKKEFVFQIWDSIDIDARFLFNKIITGGFRVGVAKKTIIKALSLHLDQDEAVISHRLMGNWSPETTTFDDLLVKEDGTENYSRPYPFYLAHTLEDKPGDLSDSDIWSAEWKWDGIRGQVIKREGNVFIWSRGEELITDKFPEIQSIQSSSEDNFVIDGEILAFSGGKPLPFAELQRRLNRKKVGKKLLADVPVVFKAYDLLEYDGKDIRSSELLERRAILTSLISKMEASDSILYSSDISFDNWEHLVEIRQEARSLGAEGLMLKRKGSTYGVGRKKGDWWKWKVDPFTIDAVLLYAMRGHGRRSNLFSDFTFAVWDNGRLVPFAKAYSGLEDSELNEITRFVKKNTVESFGPVRSVNPEHVFELAFEGIARSSRHKSGVSVRFPRILRWRKDKVAEEANTLNDLLGLLKLYEG